MSMNKPCKDHLGNEYETLWTYDDIVNYYRKHILKNNPLHK